MKNNIGHWTYDGEDFDVNEYFGFIYIITNNLTGKKYLGRKFFHVHQKRKRDDKGERTWYNNHIGAVKWIAPFEQSEAARYKISVALTDNKKYCFSHKDGKVHHGDRLSLIAYDNKVTRKGLSKVITGLRKTHYGWSLVN